MKTYKIPVQHLPTLNAQLAELSKKADKLGVARPSLTFHGEESKVLCAEHSLVTYTQTWAIVSVTGEAPKLDGWRLVAVVERQESGENMVRCVPGETCWAEYRTTDTSCNHCNTNRRRSEVFVLGHDDGRHVQVGRNCLSDFLGGKSPEGLVAAAEFGFFLDTLVSEAEGEFWGGGRGGEPTYNTEQFLKLTAAVIRKHGWLSRTVAREQMREGQATADTVLWILTPPGTTDAARAKNKFIADLDIQERDMTLATDALAWAVSLPADQGDDYSYNLGVAARLGYVRVKTAGIVGSAIAAYQRKMDREAELNMRRAEAKNRTHVGTVGERTGFAGVTVKSVRSFESDFGVRTMIRFETVEGNTLVWWASGDSDIEEGHVIDITGTIKKHEVYKEFPQTVLSRVSKGLPKQRKPRRKPAA